VRLHLLAQVETHRLRQVLRLVDHHRPVLAMPLHHLLVNLQVEVSTHLLLQVIAPPRVPHHLRLLRPVLPKVPVETHPPRLVLHLAHRLRPVPVQDHPLHQAHPQVIHLHLAQVLRLLIRPVMLHREDLLLPPVKARVNLQVVHLLLHQVHCHLMGLA